MSWLDRLKGKGAGPREPEEDIPPAPRTPFPRQTGFRRDEAHEGGRRESEAPSVEHRRSGEARAAEPRALPEEDLDALLNDIVSELAAGTAPKVEATPQPVERPAPRVQAPHVDAPAPVREEPRRPFAEPLLDFEDLIPEAPEPKTQPDLAVTAPAPAPEPEPEPEPEEPPAVEEAEDLRPPEERMAAALAAAGAGDFEGALAIWEPLAREGNARAQNNIGACFTDGLGVERDLDLARRWLELSAEGGDPVGRRNLATLYFKGEGVAQDYARAAELYRAAAEDGDAPAQDMLSWMLLEGEVIPSDPAEARRWALAAAEQGVASSMTRLGMMANNAIGMERDPAEAVRWWRKGAEAGDADGQAMLGAAYHLGAGVPRDNVAAFAWLIRAKAGHSTLAQKFFEPVREKLTPDEESAARRRAAVPLREVP